MSADRLAIWPSIDLREGRVVRLLRGEWDAVTTFDADAVEIARTLRAPRGPTASTSSTSTRPSAGGRTEERFSENVEAIGLPVQVGGGMRTAEVVEDFLERVRPPAPSSGHCRSSTAQASFTF